MKSSKSAYQLVVVLANKASDSDKKMSLEKLTSLVEGQGAKVAASEHLGVKDLAYEIKGQVKGDFYNLKIESEKPVGFREIGLFMNRDISIIRYLALKD